MLRLQVLAWTTSQHEEEDDKHGPNVIHNSGQTSHRDFKAQQRHLEELVLSLDDAIGSLLPHRSKLPPPRTRSSVPAKYEGSDRDSPSTVRKQKSGSPLTPEEAAALAAQALAAVKASLTLTRKGIYAGWITQEEPPQTDSGARQLRVALARAIGALRTACVGAASSTAELLGGGDPTGFAQEVRALADAHEKELEQAMAAEEPSHAQAKSTAHSHGGQDKADDSDAGEAAQESHTRVDVGLDFWARQSDLWSGVFAEQQTGLLQMVRAQEAELRQGKLRIFSLEEELSALDEKHVETARTVPKAVTSHEETESRRPLTETDERREQLRSMQRDYDALLSALRERESTVEAGEARLQIREAELVAEHERLKAGAAALSTEADGLR